MCAEVGRWSMMERMDEDAWLGHAELEALRSLGARRTLPSQTTLFVEGDEPYDVVIIEAGEVKITTTALTGQELVLDILGEGDVLGELSAIDGTPRSATAVALTDIEVTALPAGRFTDFLDSSPVAQRALLELTVRRLRLANRRQLEYSSSDALGRVCARLDELAARSDGAVHLDLGLTQTELAQWCGLSREAVVKALRKLRNLGWVTTTPEGAMTIEDPDQLRARGQI
jgi:CRP/FNR family transcriptional regulator, cyclic AMP receptor protein